MTTKAPKVGDVIDIGQPQIGIVRVLRVYKFGTMDVESVATGNCYRITGLGWL